MSQGAKATQGTSESQSAQERGRIIHPKKQGEREMDSHLLVSSRSCVNLVASETTGHESGL